MELFHKKDYFNFPIVNFPFICSNIPVEPAYDMSVDMIFRSFLNRGLLLTWKLLNQVVKLKSSFKILLL